MVINITNKFDVINCKGSAIFLLVYFKYHKWKIVYSLQSLCRSASL